MRLAIGAQHSVFAQVSFTAACLLYRPFVRCTPVPVTQLRLLMYFLWPQLLRHALQHPQDVQQTMEETVSLAEDCGQEPFRLPPQQGAWVSATTRRVASLAHVLDA